MTSLRSKLIKPWIVMPLVALVGFGGWFFLVRPDDDATATATSAAVPRTAEAVRGTLARTISAEGTVQAAQSEQLSFTSSGTVTAVHVEAGDEVKTGQVLATIDSAELEAAVAQADASLAEAQAKLSDDLDAGASDAQIDADESAVQSAQDSLDNANEALAGAELKATFDGTIATVNITVGEELGTSGTGGTSQSGSQSGSGNTSGTIGSPTNPGLPGAGGAGTQGTQASDASADPHLELVSTGRYTVELSIDSSDINNVKVGQVATVSPSASTGSGFPGGGAFPGGGRFPRGGGFAGAGGVPGGDTDDQDDDQEQAQAPPVAANGVDGLVVEVAKVADASSGVAAYPVTIAFNDTSGDFNAGATVAVDITYDQVEGAIQVPLQAVTTTDGSSTVTVLANGQEEVRTVTTGLTAGANIEITEGLREGETVVIQLPAARGGGGGLQPPGGQLGGGGS